jgi:hypothetical protein
LQESNVDFDASEFGISAADVPDRYSNKEKGNLLRVCVVNGPTSSALVFRIEKKSGTDRGGTYAEKLLCDAIIENQPWACRPNGIPFHGEIYRWWDQGQEVKSEGGFPVRLVHVNTGNPAPGKLKLVPFAQKICNHLNQINNNRTSTDVEEQRFYWQPRAVWSDIISPAACRERLLSLTKPDHPGPGYYEKHVHLIHSYYRLPFSPELAVYLHAPMTTTVAVTDQSSVQDSLSVADNDPNEDESYHDLKRRPRRKRNVVWDDDSDDDDDHDGDHDDDADDEEKEADEDDDDEEDDDDDDDDDDDNE